MIGSILSVKTTIWMLINVYLVQKILEVNYNIDSKEVIKKMIAKKN
jgi:hypothetical protein